MNDSLSGRTILGRKYILSSYPCCIKYSVLAVGKNADWPWWQVVMPVCKWHSSKRVLVVVSKECSTRASLPKNMGLYKKQWTPVTLIANVVVVTCSRSSHLISPPAGVQVLSQLDLQRLKLVHKALLLYADLSGDPILVVAIILKTKWKMLNWAKQYIS